jgi:hypothetical protein
MVSGPEPQLVIERKLLPEEPTWACAVEGLEKQIAGAGTFGSINAAKPKVDA